MPNILETTLDLFALLSMATALVMLIFAGYIYRKYKLVFRKEMKFLHQVAGGYIIIGYDEDDDLFTKFRFISILTNIICNKKNTPLFRAKFPERVVNLFLIYNKISSFGGICGLTMITLYFIASYYYHAF